MYAKLEKDRRIFEIMLMVVVLGMSMLFYKMGQHKIVVLPLFFLPVVLSGYFLGRSSAGELALFCAVVVTIATTVAATGFAAYDDPTMVGMVLTVWAAVLGLTALLTGTLCDERAKTLEELHTAYVGVVDVVSRYLQGANPDGNDRASRVTRLSKSVGRTLKLSPKEVDDLCVASLLFDLESFEITTKMLSKAVNVLETKASALRKHTFLGTDLVHSIGSVLQGALPLLVNQDEIAQENLDGPGEPKFRQMPIGARILSTVRAFDSLTHTEAGQPPLNTTEAIAELRRECGGRDDDILNAIERVVGRESAPKPEPAAVG